MLAVYEVSSIQFKITTLTISFVKTDPVIPTKADTYITTDIHSIPTRVNASAIAVDGLRSYSFAKPASDTAMRQ